MNKKRFRKPKYHMVDDFEPIKLPEPEKIKWYNKLWWKLDGKKALIGGGLIVAGLITSAFVPPIGKGIEYLGGMILTGGVVHKVVKGTKKANKEDRKWWEYLITILIEILKQFKKIGG